MLPTQSTVMLFLLALLMGSAAAAEPQNRATEDFVRYCESAERSPAEQLTLTVIRETVAATDCADIAAKMSDRTHLRLVHPKLSALKPLSFFTTLKRLTLVQHSSAASLPLHSRPTLTCPLALAQLAGLPLRSLYLQAPLHSCGFDGLQVLAGTLSDLQLHTTAIASLEQLPELPKLRGLRITSGGLTTLEGLDRLGEGRLLRLAISDNSVTDLGELEATPSLQELDISYNPVEDLSPLTTLPQLNDLSARGLRLSAVPKLGDPSELSYLDLSDNSLEDISGIAAFEQICGHLALSGNMIRDVTPLLELKFVTSLDLSHNPLNTSHTKGGRQSKELPRNLEEINLSYTGVADFDWLKVQQPKTLERLVLRGNRLEDLQPLARFHQLRSVDLGANLVKSVKPIAGLKRLTELTLDSNPLGTHIAKTSQNCPTDGASRGVRRFCTNTNKATLRGSRSSLASDGRNIWRRGKRSCDGR